MSMKYYKMAKNLMAGFLSKNKDLKRFLTEKNDLIFFSENTYFEIIKRPNSFKKVYFKESLLPFETQELLKKRISYLLTRAFVALAQYD